MGSRDVKHPRSLVRSLGLKNGAHLWNAADRPVAFGQDLFPAVRKASPSGYGELQDFRLISG